MIIYGIGLVSLFIGSCVFASQTAGLQDSTEHVDLRINCANSIYKLSATGNADLFNSKLNKLFIESYEISRLKLFKNRTYQMSFSPQNLECKKPNLNVETYRCDFQDYDHYGNSDSIAPTVEFITNEFSENSLKFTAWVGEDGRWEDGTLNCHVELSTENWQLY